MSLIAMAILIIIIMMLIHLVIKSWHLTDDEYMEMDFMKMMFFINIGGECPI